MNEDTKVQIGCKLGSSCVLYDDFLGFRGEASEKCIIRRFVSHRSMVIDGDSEEAFAWRRLPQNSEEICKRVAGFHDKMKDCEFAQGAYSPSDRDMLLILDYVPPIDDQVHYIDSRNIQEFLFMTLTCLECAHRNKISHGEIRESDIAWNRKKSGDLKIQIANWAEARDMSSMTDDEVKDCVLLDIQSLGRTIQRFMSGRNDDFDDYWRRWRKSVSKMADMNKKDVTKGTAAKLKKELTCDEMNEGDRTSMTAVKEEVTHTFTLRGTQRGTQRRTVRGENRVSMDESVGGASIRPGPK